MVISQDLRLFRGLSFPPHTPNDFSRFWEIIDRGLTQLCRSLSRQVSCAVFNHSVWSLMDPDLTCLFPLFTPLWNPRNAFQNDFRFEKAPAKWKWQSRQRNTRKHTHHKNTNTHTAKPLNEKNYPKIVYLLLTL